MMIRISRSLNNKKRAMVIRIITVGMTFLQQQQEGNDDTK